jgi:NitT/TauT family transport system permease protein
MNMTPRWTIFTYRIVFGVVLFFIWEAVVRMGFVKEAFLPGPISVLSALIELSDVELVKHVWFTLYEALVGYGLGVLIGVVVGVTLGSLPRVNEVLAPYIAVFNAMPRIALAPLFVLWFGIGSISHIALVFSIVVFIVMNNTIAGALSVDRDLVILSKLYRASRWKFVTKVIFPTAIPWIFAAMRLGWAYALAGAVVGQMFLGQVGLGYVITASSGVFNIANVFVALILTVTIAWAVDTVIRIAEHKVLRWRTETPGTD